MNIKLAKEFKELAILDGAGISGPTLGFSGYTVHLAVKGKHEMLETARGDARQFKSLDAAAKVLKELGFSEWKFKA